MNAEDSLNNYPKEILIMAIFNENTLALKAQALEAWQRCSEIMSAPNASDDDLAKAYPAFEEAHSALGGYVGVYRNDEEMRALWMHLARFTEGLDDTDKHKGALVQCLRGSFAVFLARQMYQKQGTSNYEIAAMAAEILVKNAGPAYNKALRLKPDYTAAQKGFSEAKELLNEIKEQYK